jgi:hypothetical protein
MPILPLPPLELSLAHTLARYLQRAKAKQLLSVTRMNRHHLLVTIATPATVHTFSVVREPLDTWSVRV